MDDFAGLDTDLRAKQPLPLGVFVQAGTRKAIVKASERQIQISIINRLARLGFVCAHVPNEGQRSEIQKKRAAQEGLRSGFPDLIVLGQGRVGFLEVKTLAGSLSDEQRAWINTLHRMGHRIAVVRDQDAAVQALRLWGWL